MGTKQGQRRRGRSEGQEDTEAEHTEGFQTEIYSETKAMWCGANVVQCVIRDAVYIVYVQYSVCGMVYMV